MSLKKYVQLNNNKDDAPELLDYRVIIAGLRGGPVTGVLQENITFGGGNDFSTSSEVLSNMPIGGSIGAAVSAGRTAIQGAGVLAGLAGRSVSSELATRKIWNNSRVPSIPISMEFYQDNTNADEGNLIMEKVRRLKSAVYPDRQGLFFRAPLGYQFVGNTSNQAKGTISVSIGRWFRATGLVMEDLSVNFSNTVNGRGQPIKAVVSMTFTPFRVITYDEFLAYFLSPPPPLG